MLEIRRRYNVGSFRYEKEWPLARTQYTKLFLNASDGKMSDAPFEEESQVRYNASNVGDKTQNAHFEFEFDTMTELIGHMKLKLWVEAVGSEDMDLFVDGSVCSDTQNRSLRRNGSVRVLLDP
jgi:predicted acyl esterase